jgi:hypothetical protein
MKFKLQLVIEDENGKTHLEDIIDIDKTNQPGYCIGLSLLDSRELLKELQQKIILNETYSYLQSKKTCSDCQHKRRVKSHETFQYRTLFGTVVLPNLRLYNCGCDHEHGKTFSVLNDWLADHTSPELQYIEAKWASHLSYNKSCELLKDILPIHITHNAVTVHNHLQKIAERQDGELVGKPTCLSGCENDWAELPKPDKPLTVGIDGGYVRQWRDKHKNFEVIVGKSYSKTKVPKRFGFVQRFEERPQRRLLSVLTEQGLQANQQITFLSDGADNVRDLQYLMHPEAEHILDWFHVTMRLTVLQQYTKGVIKNHPEEGKALKKHFESTKWHLWHGNVTNALDHLEDCCNLCDDDELTYHKKKDLIKHIEELTTYIENNAHLIPNYGERWRYKEPISSSFVESTVNEVITKRMVKKQQMQWTLEGAHNLLQVRIATLNDDLAKNFERWYPGLKINDRIGGQEIPLKKAA